MFGSMTSATTAVPLAADAASVRPRLLCVDDEPHVLEGLRDILYRRFDVELSQTPDQALAALRAHPEEFAVVISDMRMPQLSGAEFLGLAARIAPGVVRILLTGHADLDDAIKAVNRGQLFRFLTKPCSPDDLYQACSDALAQHQLQRAERDLLEQTLRSSVEALAETLALSSPAVFGRSRRIKDLAGQLARRDGLENWWEVEVAAMLADLGAVALPSETAVRLYEGSSLSEAERTMVARVPHTTRTLLRRIPRLEGVVSILGHRVRPAGTPISDDDRQTKRCAEILRLTTEYCLLEASGSSSGVALGALRSRGHHDPKLLAALADLVGATHIEIAEISVAELRVGTTFVEDVRSQAGLLLVARGQQVTEQLRERLRNLGSDVVREPLRIQVDG